MTEPLFTSEQVKEDGRNRVKGTGFQVGGATALVGLGSAFLRQRGLLHGPLDPIGFGYWVTLLTISASALTNLSRLRGKS